MAPRDGAVYSDSNALKALWSWLTGNGDHDPDVDPPNVDATGTTSLGKAEDAAHVSGDLGIPAWAVRKDTAAATAADGDYHPLEVDALGRLHSAATLIPVTTGGLSVYRNINLGVVGQVVKASAGQIYNLFAYNLHTVVQFVKIYNKATAADETDVPIATIPVPAGSGVVIPIDHGEAYATGISVRGTGALADNDTTATTASTLILKLDYK